MDGILFDSKAESAYYEHLKEEKERGNISDFDLQPVYELIPRFQKDGKTYRKTLYIGDFLVTYPNGYQEVIDVKGKKTPVFNLKKKLFHYMYPKLKLRLVKQSGKKWVDLE